MNKSMWELYLKTLTGEYGESKDGKVEDYKHLGITFNFFKELKLDSSEKTFLDVGCAGSNTNSVNSKWYGIDIIKHKNVRKCDAHEICYADEIFDIVFSSHVLEHVLSPIIVLSEIRRVLKDNGDVIIGVPVSPHFMGASHLYVLSDEGWKNLFIAAKFKLVHEQINIGCGCYHLRKEL